MSEMSTVRGFDPESDGAMTPRRTRVREAYEALQERGREDLAKRLRHTDRLADQDRLLREEVLEFDPKHDDAPTGSKLHVRQVYDRLIAAGHDDVAEELRWTDRVQEQMDLARDLKRQLDDAENDVDAEVAINE